MEATSLLLEDATAYCLLTPVSREMAQAPMKQISVSTKQDLNATRLRTNGMTMSGYVRATEWNLDNTNKDEVVVYQALLLKVVIEML